MRQKKLNILIKAISIKTIFINYLSQKQNRHELPPTLFLNLVYKKCRDVIICTLMYLYIYGKLSLNLSFIYALGH